MRWPLRRQILLPMLVLMLATLAGASGLNAWLSTRRTLREIEQQLADVVRTLAGTNFPLAGGVLRQMHGLTGAHYAVTDTESKLIAGSDEAFAAAPRTQSAKAGEPLALEQTLDVRGVQYFYAAARLDRRAAGGETLLLHIYYPVQRWQAARSEAVLPPLAVGGGAIVLVGLLSVVIAGRVTRPIARLKSQVEGIAEGNFQPLPPPALNDEVRDLGAAINRMAGMLARYEEQVRRNERLRTLGQLGGGLAHQMRNAATGCRMALDLHRRGCPGGETDENLNVAERQLTLMEQHLRRFLALGRTEDRERRPVDFGRLVADVLPLVRHTAAHVGVQLEYISPDEPITVEADVASLQQAVVNLLLNGIEAVASAASRRADAAEAERLPTPADAHGAAVHGAGAEGADGRQRVTVSLARTCAGRAQLRVCDTGPGPDAQLAERMFEPLVSDKSDGAGLGLAVAREVVEHHGGRIAWRRDGAETCFEIELPEADVESKHGATADR